MTTLYFQFLDHLHKFFFSITALFSSSPYIFPSVRVSVSEAGLQKNAVSKLNWDTTSPITILPPPHSQHLPHTNTTPCQNLCVFQMDVTEGHLDADLEPNRLRLRNSNIGCVVPVRDLYAAVRADSTDFPLSTEIF